MPQGRVYIRKFQVLEFFSGRFNERERKMCIMDKELLSLVLALKIFRNEISGNKLLL